MIRWLMPVFLVLFFSVPVFCADTKITELPDGITLIEIDGVRPAGDGDLRTVVGQLPVVVPPSSPEQPVSSPFVARDAESSESATASRVGTKSPVDPMSIVAEIRNFTSREEARRMSHEVDMNDLGEANEYLFRRNELVDKLIRAAGDKASVYMSIVQQ